MPNPFSDAQENGPIPDELPGLKNEIARLEKQISEQNRRNNLTTGFWVSLVVFGTCLAIACLFFVKAVEAIQLAYIATAFFGCSFLLVFIVLPSRKP